MEQQGYTYEQVTVGQRVSMEYYGKQRVGTVKEVYAPTGYVRVELDRVTMHEWVKPSALTPLPEPPDDALGAAVTWEYEGCPHYCPRRQLEGVVLDVRTRWGDGAVQVLVKSPELNLPKWVDLDAVQFVAKQTAEAVASAVA